MSLEVLDPGLLTTVQDAGRPGWTHLGVPVGGACDRWSLAVANLLAGNTPEAAALEMTLVGGRFRATASVRIGLAGADLGGHVADAGRRLESGRTHFVEAGSTIAFPGVVDVARGARAYFAVGGGIAVPEVLGSRSTALAAGFGGLDGRALRRGDVIEVGPMSLGSRSELTWPVELIGEDGDSPIRVIRGPWAGIDDLTSRIWRVASGSDRVGLRLEGQPIRLDIDTQLPSFGVIPGAIQVPPDGAPIVLLADAQTTGGYPVAAVAIAADLPRLGQLRPGAEVRFEEVSIVNAADALRRQQAALVRVAALLREAAALDDAWQGAGG